MGDPAGGGIGDEGEIIALGRGEDGVGDLGVEREGSGFLMPGGGFAGAG